MKLDTNAWARIADAMQFYNDLGYTTIDVPWIVHREASAATFVPHEGFPTPGHFPYDQIRHSKTCSEPSDLVGSAEQGFVQLITEGKIDPSVPYVACTPCFRLGDKGKTRWHAPYFMKVELFELDAEPPTRDMCADAMAFFGRYAQGMGLGIRGGDIEVNGYEVGTYGARMWKDFTWSYGTGLAEPRFGWTIEKAPGYHEASIPRGEYGQPSKVREECEEFLDAIRQSNPLMALVELSDLLGAVQGYLTSQPGTSFDDLLKMAKTTQRAFQSQDRK